MSFLKNTVSLFALFSVIPAAYAVTARPSVLNSAASRRMPTMTAFITGTTSSTTTTAPGSTTTSSLLANAECIDAYSSCIKGADACGPNFEECTTRVLFHAQMPECLSTLAQCSSAGVNSLFGTSNITALNNVSTKNTYGEITDYTYPTDGSVLGQMISAAAIENKYNTSDCVRRYSSCLRKDSVCGVDFELCTTNSEFKKQRVLCDSTLARCQSEGLIELFGTASTTANPSASSRIGEMITEGAALAAVNAVSTCYKVVDQCILNACAANPYKCYENAATETIDIVDAINSGTEMTAVSDVLSTISRSDISAYIKNSCLDTIGANKYCYATFIGDGQMPTASQLRDEDNQAEVYDLAYNARMNSAIRAQITELVNKFDTRAKEKCMETIRSCAMRTCGSGSGAACYSQVFGATDKSINNDYTREEIRTGCLSVVNSDPNCKYAAQNPNQTGTYKYSFVESTAFDTLFPEYDSGAENDPIGVIASLNASLANNYSDAALAQMKKRCQSVATSCVRSMCGSDFVNCYRNRTDIYSSLTNSGDSTYDKSMNKVGGVLDYTIVLGLCIDTVKNASVCSEHLAIETNKYKIQDKTSASSWGTGSVRGDWVDAGGTSAMTPSTESVQSVDENGNNLCSDKCGNQGVCDTSSTEPNCGIYETPVTIAYTTYVETQAANSLFKDLIYDLEIEAQAKYNAKLTNQQNMCMSMNQGGIVGKNDLGSTFLWAKLRSNKVPKNYSVAGLKSNQFVASNDLYGSFCRVRITLQSDDRELNELLRQGQDWSTAYFAAGDTFTCGSWIPSSKLEDLANKVAGRARAERKEKYGDMKDWATIIGGLGGGIGGYHLGQGIQDGSVFSGLTGKTKPKKDAKKLTADNCNKQYTNFTNAIDDENMRSSVNIYVNNMIDLVESNVDSLDESYVKAQNAISNVRTTLSTYRMALNNSQITPTETKKTEEQSCSEADTKTKKLAAVNNFLSEQGCYKNVDNFADYYNACTDQTNSDYFKNGNTYIEEDCCDKTLTNGLKVRERARNIYNETKCTNTVTVTDKSVDYLKTENQNTLTKAATDLENSMLELRGQCITLANKDDKADADKNWFERAGATAISTVAGTVVGGILTNKIVDSIQDQELNNVERAAYNEFMDSIGSKIRCYVGADEVGMYGDIILTSME